MKTIKEYIEEYLWEDKSHEDQPDGTGVMVMSEGRVREVMKKYAEDVVEECKNEGVDYVIQEQQYWYMDNLERIKQQIK